MTAAFATWKIGSATDAARARVVVARLTATVEAPVPDRARFLADLTAQLRRCLDQDGAWELRVTTLRPTGEREGRMTATLRRAGRPGRAAGADNDHVFHDLLGEAR